MSLGWNRFWEVRNISQDLVSRELTSDRWRLIEQAVLNSQ